MRSRDRTLIGHTGLLFNQVAKIVLEFLSKIRVKTDRSLQPGKDMGTFALVDSAPDDLFRGFLASAPIPRAQIGGIWVPRRFNQQHSSRVLLHFHGGAYVILSPRSPGSQYGSKMLCDERAVSVAFCPEYRLSSNPDGTFPAQLQDALASYYWLVHTQGVEPSRIVFSGDSAGAHLVLTLLRYLTEHPDTMALPRAALLHSPWLNLTSTGTDVDGAPSASTDYLSSAFLRWGAQTFSPKNTPLDSGYMSPLFNPFAVAVPLWVQVGTAEVFYPDILDWVKKMEAVQGNIVELHESPDAMHDIFTVGGDFGLPEMAREGARKAAAFLDKVAPI